MRRGDLLVMDSHLPHGTVANDAGTAGSSSAELPDDAADFAVGLLDGFCAQITMVRAMWAAQGRLQ